LKFISWNVNGLRACVGKGFLDFFNQEAPDFLCIQETKLQAHQIDLDLPGYEQFFYDAQKKGYSGTAIFAKAPPISVSRGIGIEPHDNEGRVLTLEYADFFLINVYTPNSQRGLARLDYRMEWDAAFRDFAANLAEEKPCIICGDLNVAHQEIDIANPKSNRRNAGFTDEERGQFTKTLAAGFVDTFRHLHPDTPDAYTWWSYMANSRARNIGWRIDYFLTSQSLAPQITKAEILPEIHGSDHCPVFLEIKN